MPNVLAISGSPRKDGNSDTLLNEFLRGMKENGLDAEVYHLRDLDIKHCKGCNSCFESGYCHIKDDMQILYARLEAADMIVLATPVYFSGMSSLMKQMVDRCQCLWARKEVMGQKIGPPGRKGFLLCVGGQREPVFRNIISVTRSLFNSIDVSYGGEVLVSRVDDAGEMEGEPSKLEEARLLGSRA